MEINKTQIVDFDQQDNDDPISYQKEGSAVVAKGSDNMTARSVLGLGSDHTNDVTIVKDIISRIVDGERHEALAYAYFVAAYTLREINFDARKVITKLESKLDLDTVVRWSGKEVTKRTILEWLLTKMKSLTNDLIKLADYFESKDINYDKCPRTAKLIALLDKLGER